MRPRTANRLWMAWSLSPFAAIAAVFWVAFTQKLEVDGQEVLAPMRSGIGEVEVATDRIGPVATQLEANADEVSRIAQRQLPRPPFGLVEPPFVREMREREEGLLAALAEIRDHLEKSKRQLLDLQEQLNGIETSMQSGVDRLEYVINTQ